MGDITTAGVTSLMKLGVGEVEPDFSVANAYIGVGDSSTAFTTGQTNLQAATNKFRAACTGASRTGLVYTFTAPFASGEANFAWNEVGVFNDGAAGTMLCRKVQSIGTKSSGQSWTVTVTLTLAAA